MSTRDLEKGRCRYWGTATSQAPWPQTHARPLLPQHPVHTGLAVTAGIRASGPAKVAEDRTHGADPDRAGTPDDQSL